MSDVAIDQRLHFMQIDAETKDALREVRPLVEAALPDILVGFYDHVRSWPDVAKFFEGQGHMDMAKNRQIQHWGTILSGEFNQTYVEGVRKIGMTHARIGLEPRWYIGGYAFITTRLARFLTEKFAPGPFTKSQDLARLNRYIGAINKAAMLDMDFAISIYLEESERAKKDMMHNLADDFERSVLGVVETVASAATQLEQTARTMAGTAEATSERSSSVSAAAEEATANVSVVAASAEQMGKSVQEISEQVSQSTQIAGEAVGRAQATNETIESLSRAADKIGEVVNMISDIAEQTNLLALNATIESARAGEAGRGFAVGASEVKSLATQTAKATEDIAVQIQDMQTITTESVDAIASIRKTIDEINAVSVAINAAVEEQSAATQEIARNTQEAAAGTQDVSRNISGVLEGASETGAASNQVVSASGELGRQADTLRKEVERFLETVRAA